jgi:hypothetical protein
MIRYIAFSVGLSLTLLVGLEESATLAADEATAGYAGNVQRSRGEPAIDWAQYDGQRVKGSNSVWVYLILQGRLHLIPDPTTYANLFVDWNGISVNNYFVDNIPQGNALSLGSVLAKGSGDLVYLVTDGTRMLVPDPATFNQFHFSWNKIVDLPDVVMTGLQLGSPVY